MPRSLDVIEPQSGLERRRFDANAWRNPSLRAILRLTAIVGTVWVCVVLALTPDLFHSFISITFIILTTCIWALVFLPISDFWCFVALSACYFIASVVGVLTYGMPPGVPVMLTLFTLLAAIYYDVPGGILAGAASLLLIAFGCWGWVSGMLPTAISLPRIQPNSLDFWIRALFAQLMAIGAVIGIVAFVKSAVRSNLELLALAQEKYSKAFRICPDGLSVTEFDTGKYIEVNDGFEALTGFTRDEVVGHTSIELIIFHDATDRARFISTITAGLGGVHGLERQIRHRSGRPIDVLYSAETFELAGRKCIVSIIQDITNRKRSESALIASEARVRGFIENANVGIYRTTREGQFLIANPSMLKIMGYASFDELAQINFDDRSNQREYPRREFKEQIERAGTINGFETTWTRLDGTRIFVRESAVAIRDAAGNILYYDGILEDISERKRAELALTESDERFKTLTRAAFEGIVITEEGRITDINELGVAMLGYTRSEMLGRPSKDFVAPESQMIFEEHVRLKRESPYELQLVSRDARRIHVEAQARIALVGSKTVRMVAFRDITERKQQEQKQKNLEEQILQMQKMEALGTLAGGIAHDFNNILTGILGNLQIAQMDLSKGHPSYPALESADHAAHRARALVARILSFSRPRQDNHAPGPLGPTVLEAVELLRAGLPGGIEISTEIDPNCANVDFDSGQIHQAIMNLGTNSAHAISDSGGAISISLRPVKPSQSLMDLHPQVTAAHSVCLSVRDNGSGIRPEVLKRMFEPFFTTKSFGQGTGLGLAMVHTIMTGHKGAIIVESSPGYGTRFDLYFPAAVDPTASAVPAYQTPRPGRLAPFGRNRQIMLVDDEDSVRLVGANLLKRLGFLPSAFARATDALDAFKAKPEDFCIVISDLTMPGMTGVELARHVLAIRTSIPFILTSGHLQVDARQSALQTGIRSVIAKPFEVDDLVRQIQSALGD